MDHLIIHYFFKTIVTIQSCEPLPCNEFSNCNENAACILKVEGNYECQCSRGFFGDGFKCSTQTCDIINNCGENSQCLPDSSTLLYSCVCMPGFTGFYFVKDLRAVQSI